MSRFPKVSSDQRLTTAFAVHSASNINCTLAVDEENGGDGGPSRWKISELSEKGTADICRRPANAPLHKKLGKLTYNRLNSQNEGKRRGRKTG